MDERFTFARQDCLDLFLRLMFHTGAMCPKCSHGTRVTSKRWAKCKKCGERVERRPLPPVSADEVPK